MRKLVATVFNYSLDGLLSDPGTEFWDFCFGVPENREPDDPAQLEFLRSARACLWTQRLRGHCARDDNQHCSCLSGILTAAPKVVFSRTMTTADWANTTIAAGDTTEEVDRLRQGGEGHILVWGGVGLFRSLMQRDLVDELQVSMFPYIAGEGTRLFDGVPRSYQLDLVSNIASNSGVIELVYRRHR